MNAPDPQGYLAATDKMLRGAGALGAAAVIGGWWPKACACLIRLALEEGINAYWQQVRPEVARCHNGRAKLLMLRRHLPPPLVRETTYAWATLSRATHHHYYETGVSAVEIRRLHSCTTRVVAELAQAAGSRAN